MSQTLTGTTSYVSSITAPSDGDARNAASVNTAFQALINNDVYLAQFKKVFYAGGLNYSTQHTTTSTSYVDATGHTISLGTLIAGDVVLAIAQAKHYISNASYKSHSQLCLTENGSPAVYSIEAVTEDTGATSSTADNLFTHVIARTVVTGGTGALKIIHKSTNALGTSTFDQSTIAAIVLRA